LAVTLLQTVHMTWSKGKNVPISEADMPAVSRAADFVDLYIMQ